ncbi:MAG TPA: tetratricopeptide repeat protein [Chloroflexota bacterium]|nr:tetratricopeptide repeat protein [Chloroflexota bacterium]
MSHLTRLPTIFISYRRDDAGEAADRIFDSLVALLGRANVFMDIGSIGSGLDVDSTLEEHLSRCDAVLVLIGPSWLTALEQVSPHTGMRPLDSPDDHIRREIEAALGRPGVRVVPVLLDGARLPAPEWLPESIRQLTKLHAEEVRRERLQDDIRQLVERVSGSLPATATGGPQAPVGDRHGVTPHGGAREHDATAPAPGPRSARMVRTFLITDLRNYSRFTSEYGDEEAARLAGRFADLVEETAARHGGDLIELRGDEALVAFASARSALQAGVDLQDRLAEARARDASLPLLAGVGIDTGEAVPVRDGFRGSALNMAARLCGIASAGDVLVTDTVMAVARQVEGLVQIDRGTVELKGAPARVHVYQVGRQGLLPSYLPPLQPALAEPPNNLPDDPRPFIGRATELQAACALLRRPNVRLVTLTGPAGGGKTRLGLQSAATLLPHFAGGVFFVPLAPLTDPALVVPAVAAALGVHEVGDRPLFHLVVERLSGEPALLFLDNFEHVQDAAPDVASLLDACHGLTILVTSRAVLRLSREHEYPVPLMALPDLGELPSTDALARFEAVELFVERARAVRPDFRLTDENAAVVAQICAGLDGLPLALELAAARIRLFPPQALAARLSSRLKLLTGGARDAPLRQQTLRNAIEWSYGLLSDEDRRLFARLSVFPGGCSVEALEAVCAGPGLEIDALDGVARLIENSLVRQAGDAEPRFVMLETIREYAMEQLEGSEEESEVRARHAVYFTSLAEDARAHYAAGRQEAAIAMVDGENDNLRAALSFAVDRGSAETALRLASALWRYWWVRGHLSEGRRSLVAALALGGEAPVQVRADALNGAGALAWSQGDLAPADAYYRESLTLRQRTGDRKGEGQVLSNLGLVAQYRGQIDEAARLHAEALAVVREVGTDDDVAQTLVNLASAVLEQGDPGRARRLAEESLSLWRRLESRAGSAGVLHTLGIVSLLEGNAAEALDYLEQSLTEASELEKIETIAECLEAIGWVAAVEREPSRAVTLWAAAESARDSIGQPLSRWEAEQHSRFEALVAAAADPSILEAAGAAGRAMKAASAVDFALRRRALA